MTATSFTFYGVVERVDETSSSFALEVGEKVSGHMALGGAAAAAWLQAHASADYFYLEYATEVELQFAGHNLRLVGEEESLQMRSNGVDLSVTDVVLLAGATDASEPQHIIYLRNSQASTGGATLVETEGEGEASDPTYGRASIAGAWLPADVDPNLIYGSAAGETLRGRGQVSLIWAGEGDDTVTFATGSGYAWGGTGNDTVRGSSEEDQVWGGAGHDFIQGRGGMDLLIGLEGNDTISGGDGDDRIEGGDGADLLYGDGGNDTISGLGSAVHGGAGDDRLTGLSVYGDYGDDVLRGSWMQGGVGQDTFLLDFRSAAVVDDFKPGRDLLRTNEPNPGWDAFIGRAEQVGQDVIFYEGGQPMLTLRDVQLNALSENDFDFSFI